MNILIVALLISLAIILAILEIFFLPGITIAGITGALFAIAGIVYAFLEMGTTSGWVVLVISSLSFAIVLWFFMRSKTLDKMALHKEIDSVAPTTIPPSIRVGDCGVTASRLNPMGKVLIGTQLIEAKAANDWIDESQPIIIEAIEGTHLLVREN